MLNRRNWIKKVSCLGIIGLLPNMASSKSTHRQFLNRDPKIYVKYFSINYIRGVPVTVGTNDEYFVPLLHEDTKIDNIHQWYLCEKFITELSKYEIIKESTLAMFVNKQQNKYGLFLIDNKPQISIGWKKGYSILVQNDKNTILYPY